MPISTLYRDTMPEDIKWWYKQDLGSEQSFLQAWRTQQRLEGLQLLRLSCPSLFRQQGVRTTEQEGFEPPVPFDTTVFKTVALSHSATAPGFPFPARRRLPAEAAAGVSASYSTRIGAEFKPGYAGGRFSIKLAIWRYGR